MTLQDGERLAAGIEAYGALEDPPRPELQAVVELAASICGAPKAAINIITATAQHSIVTLGFEPQVCAHAESMCAFILREDEPVVVPDALLDPRFVDNPCVTGELDSVRFYAAHKLVTRDGITLGTLCVFDDEPRELDEAQTTALGTLADRIVDVFELRLAQARLERSNDRLAAFAGQVTHDLKTPLTTMSLSLELIRDELEDGAGAEDLVPLINRALGGSRRMTTMIEDVLAFARMGTTIDPFPVNLTRIAAEVAADLESRMDGVMLVLEDLPTVPGDEGQLRILLQNLVANAMKFSAEGRPPVVNVSATRVGDRWRIEVADNGIGVPEDQRERIFEPMVRLDKRIDGVGIGLATCKRVVEAHHGSIGVTSPPSGEGSNFWVELPA